MSAISPPDVSRTIEGSSTADVTPVTLDAAALDSTAPGYLRDLKRELSQQGVIPASVTVEACFDAGGSLEIQSEVDRIRGYVRAASFLGAGTVTVACDQVANPDVVRPALEACAERAVREGLRFEFEGPVELSA